MIFLSDKGANVLERRSTEVLGICAWLTPIMNKVHGTQYSEKFWTRVLSGYALATYNQQQFFRREKFSHPIPFLEINGWAPPSKKDVIQNIVVLSLRSLRGTYSPKILPSLLSRTSRVAFGARSELFARDVDATTLSFNWISHVGLPNPNARGALMEESWNAPTLEYRNICRSLPRLYVEFFGTLLNIFESADAFQVEEIFVEHYSSPFERLLTAYLGEGGASVNQLQQGGFVGETNESIGPLKRAAYDYLLTYGWVQGTQDRPFYAVRLEEFASHYEAKKQEEPKIDVLVVYNSSSNTKAVLSHYERSTSVLLKHLDRVKFPTIRLRPRALSRILRWKKIPYFLRDAPKADVDGGFSDISTLCANVRVVVHWSLPATNFLECLFVDLPVVALDTNARSTELLKPYLEFFRDVGVIHDTAEDLIHFLNHTDLMTWWKNVIAHENYCEFKRMFLRSRAEWLADAEHP